MELFYDPWPSDGATLAEALERTADDRKLRGFRQRLEGWKSLPPVRTGWTLDDREDAALEWRDRKRTQKALQNLREEINDEFRVQFCNKRLIAFGRKGGLDASPALIESDIWPALRSFNFDTSAVGEDRRAGLAFFAVRVYPALKAPNALDLVAGFSFMEAFRRFILDDPEIAKFGKEAIKIDPRYESVFVRGWSSIVLPPEWPVNWSRMVDLSSDDRSGIGMLNDPPPRAISRAEAALADRITCLLDLLRSGALDATGIPQVPNLEEKLPRTVWSHPNFYFDARQGDVLEINPDCEEPPRDMLLRRWSGILLERGDRTHTAAIFVHRRAPPGAADGSAHEPMEGLSIRARRSRAVYDAIREAGIDLANDELGNKQIADIIADDIEPPVRTADGIATLAKLIGRLRKRNLNAV